MTVVDPAITVKIVESLKQILNYHEHRYSVHIYYHLEPNEENLDKSPNETNAANLEQPESFLRISLLVDTELYIYGAVRCRASWLLKTTFG
jgi:hypothetical protein